MASDASSAGWASTDHVGGSPTAAFSRTSVTTDALLIESLDRSEVGDTTPLKDLRRSLTDKASRAVIDLRLAAARLDMGGVRAAMQAVNEHRTPPKWHAIALAIEAGAAFADGDYKLCASDSAAWLALPSGTDPIHGRDDITQMAAIAVQLAAFPRQAVTSTARGTSKTWRDKAALIRTNVGIEGTRQEAVLDTGANLSVVSESTARRLGLLAIDGGSVRSSSRSAVPVRLTIAKRLTIAGTTLSNVAFLVLKDADLNLPLPGGYEIPAIIGFPVLKALGRVTLRNASIEAGDRSRPVSQGSNLIAAGSNLFVLTQVNGLEVPLQLDTGASNTSLGARFAESNPDIVRSLQTRSTRSAGAGGATTGTAKVLRNAIVTVGSVGTPIAALDISVSETSTPGPFGTLGQDVLWAEGGSFTADFARMSITITRPRAGRGGSQQ